MNALKRAAEIIRDIAESIRQSHTLGGDWQGEDEAKADHDEMLAVAGQLDALQQTAPAVPEGWKAKVLKLCSAVENDEDLPPVKYALKCGRLINEVKDMLAAAPQPDHSPDGGEVQEKVPCKAHGRFPCPTCSLFHFQGCECGFCTPQQVQSENEVKAQALEEFAADIDKQVSEWRGDKLNTHLRPIAVGQSWAFEARTKAARLRSSGGDV